MLHFIKSDILKITFTSQTSLTFGNFLILHIIMISIVIAGVIKIYKCGNKNMRFTYKRTEIILSFILWNINIKRPDFVCLSKLFT